jgi:hypothetical protein
MNNLIFFNVNKKIVFLLMIAFYSVPMRNVSPIRAGNDSGNTYCLNGNLKLEPILVFQMKQHLLFRPDSCNLLVFR